MMLVWAKGLVFARINNLELITSSWFGYRWGAILRWEKKKRFYRNYFKETPFYKRALIRFQSSGSKIIIEPEITKISEEEKAVNRIYVFNKPTTGENDLFGSLRPYRQVIKDEVYNLLCPPQKKMLEKYVSPIISVHIRRGDFKIGNPITPVSYFITAINIIREVAGNNLKVTIFSDAEKDEIAEILKMPEVSLMEGNSDIVDLLLMSRSRIIVLSQSSSFSYWAAFLSEALVIMPGNDWQKKVRGDNLESLEVRFIDSDKESCGKLSDKIRILFS